MKYLVPIFMLFAVCASGCYNRHNEPQSEAFDDFANCKIGELRDLCRNGCVIIENGTVCVGRITSSDSEGNFYRTIVVEDASGGAEIRLGLYNSATQYPVGLMVSLRLGGLAAVVGNGVVQIGLPPQKHDLSPRELETQAVIDKYIIRSSSVEPTLPTLCEIASLDTSLCGRFVRIEGLQQASAEDISVEGYIRFADSEERAIFCFISPYADFADSEVPASEVTIQGILYKESINATIGEQFVINPRFGDDIFATDDI